MFNNLLKQAMSDAGMNLTALSAATGIGKSSISQYLSGKNEPTDKRKAVIAKALGLAPNHFMTSEVRMDFKPGRFTPEQAAKLMGKGKEFVRQGLRDGVFPWGYAVKMGSRWSYYISPMKFTEYTGIAV